MTRHIVDYRQVRSQKDPFTDPAVLESPGEASDKFIHEALKDMLHQESKNGLPDEYVKKLEKLLWEREEVLCLGFTVGPPANITNLKIKLEQNARLIQVKLRFYSQDQKFF